MKHIMNLWMCVIWVFSILGIVNLSGFARTARAAGTMRRGAAQSPAYDAVETLQVIPSTTNRKVRRHYCGAIRTLGATAVLRHLKTPMC